MLDKYNAATILRLFAHSDYINNDSTTLVCENPLIAVTYKGVQVGDSYYSWFSNGLELALCDARLELDKLDFVTIELDAQHIPGYVVTNATLCNGKVSVGYSQNEEGRFAVYNRKSTNLFAVHKDVVPCLINQIRERNPSFNFFCVNKYNQIGPLSYTDTGLCLVKYDTHAILSLPFIRACLLYSYTKLRDKNTKHMSVGHGNNICTLSNDGIKLDGCCYMIDWNEDSTELLELLPYCLYSLSDVSVVEIPGDVVRHVFTTHKTPCESVQSVFANGFVGYYFTSGFCLVQNKCLKDFMLHLSDYKLKYTSCIYIEDRFKSAPKSKANWFLLDIPENWDPCEEPNGLRYTVETKNYDRLVQALCSIDSELVDKLNVILDQM